MLKLCVLIPAFNEEKTIGEVVEKARQFVSDVVVVDDGSSDKTSSRATEKGAFCLRHTENRGKGASLQAGFEYILNRDIEAVIILDGDGQHDPSEIPKFLTFFEKGKYDIILGNRMSNPEGMPLIRWLTNKFMSAVISRLSGQKIPDSQCGYRLISRVVLEKVKCNSRNYDLESEILIKASRAGFRIGSVPIASIYSGQQSKINSIIDTIRFFKLLIKVSFDHE